MTDTWMRDQLSALADEPAPPQPRLDTLITRGRASKRRHRQAVTALSATLALAVAGVALTVVNSTARHRSVITLQPAATTPSAGPTPAEDGRSANYWFWQEHEYAYEVKRGTPVTQDAGIIDFWYGNGRPGVMATGDGPNYQNIDRTKSDSTYDEEWAAPADRASILARLEKGAVMSAPGVENVDLINAAQILLNPGPRSYRQAVIDTLASVPGITQTHGVDANGQATETLTYTEASDGGTRFLTIAAASQELTEQGSTAGTNQGSRAGVDDVTPVPAGAVTERITYIPYGATDTAPLAIETADQKVLDQSVPPNPDPATPTCTPGKPVNTTAIAVQMAGICLLDPAPGFPHRRNPDYYGEADDRSFYLSEEPAKTTTNPDGSLTQDAGGQDATIQIQPHDTHSLTFAKTLTPDADGMIGDEKYVATTTVLGVPAVEFQTDPAKDNGHTQNGLIFNVNGLGVDLFSGPDSVPFDTLVNLANSLHIPTANDG